MPAPTTVLTIGETMVLVTPAHAEPLETATDFRLEIGGAEANVASHLVRLGVPAAWASAVGDDPLGRRMLAVLERRGVDISRVRVDPDAPTAVYFKDPRGETTPVFYYRGGSAASALGPEFADGLGLADASVVHLSGITPALSETCAALVDAVLDRSAAAGTPVSFDVNHRPRLWPSRDAAAESLLALARRADLVFVGRDEAEALWGVGDAEGIRRMLGVRRLVVKDGPVGAHGFADDGTSFVPAPRVEVVEPVGAGDAFAAGFLAADLRGASMTAALESGHVAAARVLMTTGDY